MKRRVKPRGWKEVIKGPSKLSVTLFGEHSQIQITATGNDSVIRTAPNNKSSKYRLKCCAKRGLSTALNYVGAKNLQPLNM